MQLNRRQLDARIESIFAKKTVIQLVMILVTKLIAIRGFLVQHIYFTKDPRLVELFLPITADIF